MTQLIQYDPSATLTAISDCPFADAASQLNDARQQVLDDVKLFRDKGEIPAEKQPLDAGFIEWPDGLLDDMKLNGADSQIARIERCAERLRNSVDSVVVLGIGGSYMGMRAMFEALCDPCHNELDRETRKGVPRLYFEGWNLDTDHQSALLSLLKHRAAQHSPGTPEGRTAVIVISKSGGTLETAVAFRTFREFLEQQFPDNVNDLIVPVTGDTGRLRDLSNDAGFQDIFSIPDGIGGRFSVLTAVGLLPAAIAGINIRRLLQGAADMTDHFRTADYGSNAVLDYTAIGHLLETRCQMTTRVLSTWGCRLEAVGLWYDQLLSESLGKNELGATPLTGVNTRDLHSRGQQHQEGRRDKLITNLLPGTPRQTVLGIPSRDDDFDQLNQFSGLEIPDVLAAAIGGTNKAYADDNRPTTDLLMPTIDEHTLGQLFQHLMLATVVEGQLIGVNPYGQPGVEAYKQNMNAILRRQVESV
jgi:glucose-6-phosphate isomerase